MKKENRHKKKESFFKYTKQKLILFLIFLPLIYLFYLITNSIYKDIKFSQDNLKTTEAVIIDKKNYMWNDKVQHRFSYSYEFYLDGKRYENNSHKYNKFKVGQRIIIEYVYSLPKYNRVKEE